MRVREVAVFVKTILYLAGSALAADLRGLWKALRRMSLWK